MENVREHYLMFIKELTEEINDEILEQESIIQIRRLDESITDNYHPILTWIYNEETVLRLLKQSAYEKNEEITQKDIDIFLNEMRRHKYEQITVHDCLVELFKMINKL